jgi:hypothetical protein
VVRYISPLPPGMAERNRDRGDLSIASEKRRPGQGYVITPAHGASRGEMIPDQSTR